MRILLLAFISSCLCCAQQPELRYTLQTPGSWTYWVLSPSADEAIRNYSIAEESDGRLLIEDKIKKGYCVTYKAGDEATFIGEASGGDAWHIRIVDGGSRGREGWIYWSLGQMTKESEARLAQLTDKRKRLAQEKKRTVTKKAAEEKKRAAEEAQHRELAYVNSLPQLVGPGEAVFFATSNDCARDLQNVVDFGRKHGTGVEFRKKMVELVTLGCAASIATGTPLESATKNGQLVTFKAYKSGKEGVALLENVRWR